MKRILFELITQARNHPKGWGMFQINTKIGPFLSGLQKDRYRGTSGT